MPAEELKPCPFCGSPARVLVPCSKGSNHEIVGCTTDMFMLCPRPIHVAYIKEDGTFDYQWWNRRADTMEQKFTAANSSIAPLETSAS